MSRNTELQSWKDEIQEFFDWYAEIIEHTQKVREHGYNIFANDVPISIGSLNLRLRRLKNISTPKFKECKKITKSLEDSMKYRIKGLQLEVKYFQDIQDGRLAGRFGTGGVVFWTSMADDLLNESLKRFSSVFGQ